MSDDYEPALEMEATPEPAEVEAPVASTNDGPPPPDSTSQPRGQRTLSDKTRAMFRDLSSKVRSGEVSVEVDDLVPVDHTPAPAASVPVPVPAPVPVAPVLVPPTASPAAQAAAALPAPEPRFVAKIPAPTGLPAIPQADTRAAALEERERLLKEREAALDERAKKLPSSQRLIDAPVQTLAEYIRETYGITTDEELKDTITDLMTEMSETYHGVKIPEEIRARVDSRKALRSVKAYRSTLERDRAELVEREAAAKRLADEAKQKADVESYEAKAVSQLHALLAPVEATYPFLAVQDNAPAVVWEVLKAAHDEGHKLTWDQAAKFANDHYQAEHQRSQAEAAKRVARLNTLLAPAASPAPAKPAASPGGAPGPAPTQPAAAAQPTPATAPTVDPADEIIGEDRRERRARSARALVAKHGLAAR